MAIKYGRLRSVTVREIIRALGQDGFFFRCKKAVTSDISIRTAVG